MHILTIPVQKYIAETGKKHKYKENATCRTSTLPSKCSFKIPTELHELCELMYKSALLRFVFFLFSKRKRQTHSNSDKRPTQFNFPASLLTEEKN